METFGDFLKFAAWFLFYAAVGSLAVFGLDRVGVLSEVGTLGSGALGCLVGCGAVVAANVTAWQRP